MSKRTHFAYSPYLKWQKELNALRPENARFTFQRLDFLESGFLC